MDATIIDFSCPRCWEELSGKQLKLVYQLLAADFSADEIKTILMLLLNKARVIGRLGRGNFLLRKGRELFEVHAQEFAALLSELDWLGSMPQTPVRLSRLEHRKALPAEFAGVPFETYIIVDNLYQGYLHTQRDELLDEMASALYPGIKAPLKPWERIAVFYWAVSLKDFFSRKFPDFFQPMAESSDGNLLGSSANRVEAAMNAQIRALTKGDVTKEKEILALDTHRALTELNAQACEYKELNAQIKKK